MSAAIGAAVGSPTLNFSFSIVRRLAWRGLVAWLVVALLPLGAAFAAEDDAPAAPAKNPLATRQAELAAKFQRFEQVLIRLAEYSAKDDPERAALLRKAIQQSKKEALRQQFAELATQLEQGKLAAASRGQEALAQELVRLLELLLSEDALKRLAEKEARIKDYLKKVNGLIKEETDLRAQTEKSGDLKKLAEKQGEVAGKTGDLQRQIAEQEGGDASEDGKAPGAEGEGKGEGKEPGAEGEGKEPGAEGEGEGKKPGAGEGQGEGKKPGKGEGAGEGKEPAEGMGEGEGQGEGKKPGAGEGKKPGAGEGKKPGAGEGKKPGEGEGQGEGKGEGEGAGEGQGGAKKPGDKKKPSEGGAKKPGDQKKPGEGKKPGDEKKPGEEQEPSEGEGGEGEGKSGGKSQSQPGQQGQGGEGGEGGERQEQQGGDTEPARKRIAAAEQKMKDAQKKLEKAQREKARDQQEEALEDLRQAKAELEEILRQIREEEMERMLAMLEARFRKMLEMQVAVYEGTLLLSGIPETQWKANLRTYEIEAGKLSRRESQIVLEANKALSILMEEGSAVAFPEAVVQMRDDMEAVVQRLGSADVGAYTQKVEEDVLRALEEMIAALQKAQKEMEAQKGQPSQGGGQPPDQPLIDNLAELKMIRALQERINRRTELIRQELQGREQVDRDEHVEESKKLAEREERIYNVLRGIVTGANQ